MKVINDSLVCKLLSLTDTLDLLYTNPRQCDMLAEDYKSLHLLLVLMLCRAVVERRRDVISLSPTYKSRSEKAFYGIDRELHRGLYLRALHHDKSAAATPCMHCDYIDLYRNA